MYFNYLYFNYFTTLDSRYLYLFVELWLWLWTISSTGQNDEK